MRKELQLRVWKVIKEWKKYYIEAADKFEKLGWGSQAVTIRKEIDVLQNKQEILQAKLKKQEEFEEKKQREYEERIQKDREEQERLQKQKEEEARRRNPEQQRKYELAIFNITKAEGGLAKGKFQQALKRLRYAIDIFTELDCNPREIEEIKNKIKRIENY